ncbi:Checkpoint serine/threonine-protein kinase BUB1 [Smittium mucronatum]|uniref:Checkpoint serine/threonine-protein kinase BUB1 n=1 Tax=Smittium mucronatum TaxID=133383 RepID=A0A1R0H8K4_9FUNG|nr:Checkpoint serine/threonine-protein kinase BUB1 [Smittium mucronatum]
MENIASLEDFEHQKENIQPLKRGRSAKMLSRIYGSDVLGKEKDDKGLSQKEGLITDPNSDSKDTAQNWIKQEEQRFLNQIKNLKIEDSDDPIEVFPRADEVYKIGIERNAQPLERLKKKYVSFQKRLVEFTKDQLSNGSIDTESHLNADHREQSVSREPGSRRRMLGVKMNSNDSTSIQSNAVSNISNISRANIPDSSGKIRVFEDSESQNPDSKQKVYLDSQKWPDIGTYATRKKENVSEASRWKGQKLPQNNEIPFSESHNLSSFSRPQLKEKSFSPDEIELKTGPKNRNDNEKNSILETKSISGISSTTKLISKEDINSENDTDATSNLIKLNNQVEQKSQLGLDDFKSTGQISKKTPTMTSTNIKPKIERNYMDLRLIFPKHVGLVDFDNIESVGPLLPELSIEEVRAKDPKYSFQKMQNKSETPKKQNNEDLILSEVISSRKSAARIEAVTAFDTDTTIRLNQISKNSGHSNSSFKITSPRETVHVSSPTINTIDAQRQMLEIWQGNNDSSDESDIIDESRPNLNSKNSKIMADNDDYQFTMGPVAPLCSPKDSTFGLTPAAKIKLNIQSENSLPPNNQSYEETPNFRRSKMPILGNQGSSLLSSRKINRIGSIQKQKLHGNKSQKIQVYVDENEGQVSVDSNSKNDNFGGLENPETDIYRNSTGRIPTITGAQTIDSITGISSLGYFDAEVDSNIQFTTSPQEMNTLKTSFSDFSSIPRSNHDIRASSVTPRFPRNNLSLDTSSDDSDSDSDHFLNAGFEDADYERQISNNNRAPFGMDCNDMDANYDSDDCSDSSSDNEVRDSTIRISSSSDVQAKNDMMLKGKTSGEKDNEENLVNKNKKAPMFTVFKDDTSIIDPNIENVGKIASEARTNLLSNNTNNITRSEDHRLETTRDFTQMNLDFDIIDKVIEPFWPMARNVYLTLLDKVQIPVESFEGYNDFIDCKPIAKTISMIHDSLINKNRGRSSAIFHLELGNEENNISFHLKQIAGIGGFAQIYLATKGKNEDLFYVLKAELPANAWEFYISKSLLSRLENSSRIELRMGRELFIDPIAVYEYPDVSITQFEYLHHGTLLDAVNLWNGSKALMGNKPNMRLDRIDPKLGFESNSIMMGQGGTGYGLDEPLALLLISHIIRSVLSMHSVQIVHTDIKAENIMLDFKRYLEIVEMDRQDLTKSVNHLLFGREKEWAPLVKVIDFGRSVDFSVLHNKQLLRAVPLSMNLDLNLDEGELGKGDVPVWSPQADWEGVARVAHLLLFGTRMATTGPMESEGINGIKHVVIQESRPFRRYWNVELWMRLFELCLSGIPSPSLYKPKDEETKAFTGVIDIETGENYSDKEYYVYNSGEVWRDCVLERIEPQIRGLLSDIEKNIGEILQSKRYDLEKGYLQLVKKLFVLTK